MEWLVQHMDLVFGVIGALIATLATLAWKDLQSAKESVTAVNTRVDEMRDNYLARFDDVKDTIKKEIGTLTKTLNDARLEQEKEFLRKAECPLIHARQDHD